MKTKLELDLYQLKNIMADMVQVGYMKAIKVYEPTKDNVSTRELVRWFKVLGIDPSYINKMESEGLIKGKRKGIGKNSPVCYSRLEIKQALATIDLNKYINVK